MPGDCSSRPSTARAARGEHGSCSLPPDCTFAERATACVPPSAGRNRWSVTKTRVFSKHYRGVTPFRLAGWVPHREDAAMEDAAITRAALAELGSATLGEAGGRAM